MKKFLVIQNGQDISSSLLTGINQAPSCISDKSILSHSGLSLVLAGITAQKLHIVSGRRMVVLHYDAHGQCKENIFASTCVDLYDVGMYKGGVLKAPVVYNYTGNWFSGDTLVLATPGIMNRYESDPSDDGSKKRIQNIWKIIQSCKEFKNISNTLMRYITQQEIWSEKDQQSLVPVENSIMVVKCISLTE